VCRVKIARAKNARDGCSFCAKNNPEGPEFGAVEWIRTTTVLLPPAPQAGASANSATTAF
jgi:hypothetical protein